MGHTSFYATLSVILAILLGVALALNASQSSPPTYAGKRYDPHVRVELFNRCLDNLRRSASTDKTHLALCDAHSKQMAAELYAAGGAR